jgi:PAS domain-containing protein
MNFTRDEKLLIQKFRNSGTAFFIMHFTGEGISWQRDTDKDFVLDYVLDNLRICHVNQSYVDIYRYGGKEHVLGRTPRDIFGSPEIAKEILGDFYEKQKNAGIFFTLNARGEALWLASSYRVILRHGKIAGHYGIEKDVTREMEMRLAFEAN